jgi:hypothetical protein
MKVSKPRVKKSALLDKEKTLKVHLPKVNSPEINLDGPISVTINSDLYTKPKRGRRTKTSTTSELDCQERECDNYPEGLTDAPEDVDNSDVADSEADDDSEISFEDICEEHLSAYECIVEESTGIRLYNGVLLDTKDAIINNIELYKAINKVDAASSLDELTSSTLTAKGLLVNVDFQNESVVSKMTLPKNQHIIKIGCNEEEVYMFPNDFVDYNITHIMDIIKNSKSTKYKTRIECACQNLLKHADNLLALYEDIKIQINLVRDTDIIRRIERYLAQQKNRNKTLLDKISKILKRIVGYVFHQYLYEDDIRVAIFQLFDQLSHNIEFERDSAIEDLRKLFMQINDIVGFFKTYIARCKCIQQPYDPAKKVAIKLVAEDTKRTKTTTKTQKYTRRKTQGCGKYFSSQITFEIYSAETEKIYKIKIFRNGNFQAPGIRNKEMRDIIKPLFMLVEYLRDQFNVDIHVSYIISVMRNYLSYIKTPTFVSPIKDHNGKPKVLGTHIYLDKLDERLRQEKNAHYLNPADAHDIYALLSGKFAKKDALAIYDMMHVTTLQIVGIANNSEKVGGIIIKFDRPIPEKPGKKIAVKVTCAGKINFDGCNSENEVLEIYYWLHNIFRRYGGELIFNKSQLKYYASEDDGYDSIYDE